MAAFLRRHAYRGGKTPTELRERLRWAPTPPTGLPPRVLAHLLGVQIQLLRTLLDTITALETQIKRIIATHPRAHLLHQLPRDRPDQPGPGPRRNRPHPRPRHRRRTSRCRMRSRTRHQIIRQNHRRLRPLGRQHPRPQGPPPPSPTTPADNHDGPKASTATPEPAANATPTPPASWPAPGSASSGPAGTPTPPTTPSNRPRDVPDHHVPTRSRAVRGLTSIGASAPLGVPP